MPRIKWHMLRGSKADAAFLRSNLRAALAAGVPCEVDLRLTADGHAVCLHDAALDRETTGSGTVHAHTRSAIERLRQRAPDGTATDDAPLFLDELAQLARGAAFVPAAIQLDVKVRAKHASADAIRLAARALGDDASRFVASAVDADIVAALRAAAPGLATGFDPLALYPHPIARSGLDAAGYSDIAERMFAIAPDARIYYLQAALIVAARAVGVDLVAAVHARGAEVDAWTIDLDYPDRDVALRALLDVGVDQITSNEPIALAAVIEVLARGAAALSP